MAEPKDEYKMIVAFGEREGLEGQFKWVEFVDGPRIYEPETSFAEEPLENIDLLMVQTFDILVYVDRTTDARSYCYHMGCRRICR